MTSLATCIRRAGKALSRTDADGIREIMADGMTATEAVDEYLDVMGDERAQLVTEIEAHGGRPAKLSVFAPRLGMEEIDTFEENDLTPEQLAQKRRFAEYVTSRDWEDIVAEYRALDGKTGPEDTENGRINSVDAWRELSEDYRNDRSTSASVHEVASALSKKYYYEFLATPPTNGPGTEWILWTSGGTGAGKTTGLELSEYSGEAVMVFDGNLAKVPSASKKIDASMDSGRLNVVNHVTRDPIEALTNGAVIRAMRQEEEHGTGRVVPLSAHVFTHVKSADAMRELVNDVYAGEARVRHEVTDNSNGKGNAAPASMDSVLNLDYDEIIAQGKVALKDIYENGHPRTEYPLSTKLYYGFIEEPVPEGAGRFHENFEGYVAADQGAAEDVPRERGREPAAPDQDAEQAGERDLPRVRQAELQLALAPAIRSLAGTINTNIVQTTEELPGEAVPSDVEGMYRVGENEVWLVASNLPTAERAKKVFAHEAFGHLAMEETPEFNDVLASVKNLLAMGNKTFKDVAEQVAVRQGNLSETNQAKEILAYMVENDVQNGTVDRAIAAVRAKLREWGLMDGADYSEAEIKALLVRAARDLVTGAEAKQKALAAMPVQEQILSDPRAVEGAIMTAVKEVYASQTLQDYSLKIYSELETATPERGAELQQALYRSRIAPGASPDVLSPEALYQRAFHGTGAPAFPAFDINYVGTGEGAAAYGWGLYFTTKRAIAEWYQNKLAGGFTYDYGERQGLQGAEAQNAIHDDLLNSLLGQGMAIEAASRAASQVAPGAVSMYRRHDGDTSKVRTELEQQRDNWIKSQNLHTALAEDEQASRDTDWGALGAEGVMARDEAMIEAWDRSIELVSQRLSGAKNKGNLMAVEVPEDDELLHWDLALSDHSEAIQDQIMAEYPELFQEALVDERTGEPVIDGDLVTQEMADAISEEEQANRGYVTDVPAATMTGFTLYNYIALQQAGELTDAYENDRLASIQLREMGIPGHSYSGATSGETNYVIYEDAAIDITHINDKPTLVEKLLPGISGAVDQALFSRPVKERQTAFMSDWNDQTQVHPFDNRSRISRDAKSMMDLMPIGDEIHLSAIQTLAPGERTGGSSRLLDVAIGLAEKHGLPLRGTAKKFGTAPGTMTTKQLKSWYKRKGFEVSGDEVTYTPRSTEQTLFSRPGQYLQIDDSQRGQPPQDAARQAAPKGLDTRSYWALASEAGTRAFNEPPGSWEERYYTEIGRQASQAAKQPAPQSMPTEQIDMLFSRTLRSETEDSPAKPGEPFLAYRLAAADRSDLTSTNAGNADSVAYHLLRASSDEGSQPQFGFGDTLHVYEVVAEEFGDYVGFISGTGGDQGAAVGRTVDSMGRGISYSFGAGGYTSKLIESMPVAELNQRLKEQTGQPNFDWAGTGLGSKMLLSEFEEGDYAADFAESREEAGKPMPWELPGYKPGMTLEEQQALYSRRSARRSKPRLGRGGAPTPEELQQHSSLLSNERLLTDNPARAEKRPLTPEERRKMNAPLMSRYVHPDPEIEAIRAKNLAPAMEDIGVKDRVRDAVQRLIGIDWHSIKQGMIDSADAVRRLEEGLFGELLDASESAYKSILSTRNIGSVMAAVMHRGIPIYNNGVFSPRAGRKGFIEIFESITQHKDGNLLPLWELYAAALRSSRLIKERNSDGTIKEKMFTQAEIDKALTLGEQYPVFKEVHAEWQKFNSQLLDLAIKRGVINGDEAKMWRRNDYVPFYRAMEAIEYGEGQGPRSGKGGVADVRSGIKRLSGSETPIGNVFENMVMNTSYLMDAIFRNTAMQRVVAMADMIAMEKIPMAWEAQKFEAGDIAKALMNAGLIVGAGTTEADMFNDGIRQVEAMSKEQREQWVTLFRRVAPRGNDVVSVLENGKPVYYRVLDPLLLRSIGAMGAQQWGGVMNIFRLAKRTLTGAVTIDPAFMLANFIRDTLSTSVITKGSATKQITGAIKGLRAAWNEDEDMLALMMAGAGGGGFYDHNPAEVRKMLAKKMPKGEVNHFMNSVLTPKGMWRFWQKVGNASEQGNRISMFRNTLEATKTAANPNGSVAEAAYQARDVLNFTMSGDYNAMKFIVQTVPFLNARIQGLYRLYRGGKENPVGFAMKGMGIAVATWALLLRNLDDDRYKELPEWDKDTYWHFFIGDEHFRLPKPFEVGAIFGTIPERMALLATGDDEIDTTFDRARRMVADTFAFNPIPQAVKPLLEQYANRNMFTGNPIISRSQEGLEPEAQYDPWTSETMRELGKLTGTSPKRLQSLIRGYTGTVGMYALMASDAVTRRAFGHPDRPTRGLHNMPVVTRFWRDPNPRTSKYATELYDMLNEADELYRTMNAYRKQRRLDEVRKIMTEDKGKLAARAYLHDIASAVSDINAKIRHIQYGALPPDTKKERIDSLNQKRLRLMAKVARVSDIF